jgi:hypothetical protein
VGCADRDREKRSVEKVSLSECCFFFVGRRGSEQEKCEEAGEGFPSQFSLLCVGCERSAKNTIDLERKER